MNAFSAQMEKIYIITSTIWESIIEELLLLVKHNKLPCSACKRLKKKFSGFQSELPLRKED